MILFSILAVEMMYAFYNFNIIFTYIKLLKLTSKQKFTLKKYPKINL
jgi:hypothetical protein